MSLTIPLAMMTMLAAPLNSQDRQDTIYVLKGDRSALDTFQRRVGSQWTGGTVLDDDTSDGVLTYWAYSERTAAESRAFMMPAIVAGLAMSFESYDERKRFPAERQNLDQVAAKCGAPAATFFLTPKRTVELVPPIDAPPVVLDCLSEGVLRDAKLPIADAAKSKDNH